MSRKVYKILDIIDGNYVFDDVFYNYSHEESLRLIGVLNGLHKCRRFELVEVKDET